MDFIPTATTVLGFAALLGGGVGFFSAARSKAIIDLLKEEISAQKTRVETLQAQYADVSIRAAEAEKQVKYLTAIATQAPAFEKLMEVQGKQHSQVIATISEMTARVSETTLMLSELVEKVKPNDK